jgi:hypothetical protein
MFLPMVNARGPARALRVKGLISMKKIRDRNRPSAAFFIRLRTGFSCHNR